MSQKAEEQYVDARSHAECAIHDMIKTGQAAGFTNPQILDDIRDALFNEGIKVEITEE